MSASKILRLCIFLAFCFILLADTGGKTNQKNPNTLLKIMELKSGLKLRYTLMLPSGYSRDKSYPLVVALHYGGKVTPFYGFEFLVSVVEPALKDLEAILVAPDCPAMGWTNPMSEESVLELMVLCMENYRIDADRVLVVGFSMGGLGAWYLASRHPDIFSAVIPIAAPADPETTPLIENVPIYIIHGEKDEIFPLYEVKELYSREIAAGAEIQLMVVVKANHHELTSYIPPLKAAIPWIRRIWEERLTR